MLLYFYNASFFGGDLLVSFASAHQASLIDGNLLEQLLQSWNLRGFGYKLIIYLDYLLISNWVNMFTQPKLFCLVYKIIHSLLIILTLVGGYLILKNRIKALGLKVFPLLISILTITFSASFLMIGQPEEYAFIFTLWMIAFGLANRKILNYLAGGFIFMLFALKVTTIAFAIFPLAIFWFYRKQIKLKAIIIGFVGGVGLTAILYSTLLLPDLKDVLEASIFQNSGRFNFNYFKKLIKAFGNNFIYQPFLFTGIFVFLIFCFKKFKDSNLIILLCTLFL